MRAVKILFILQWIRQILFKKSDIPYYHSHCNPIWQPLEIWCHYMTKFVWASGTIFGHTLIIRISLKKWKADNMFIAMFIQKIGGFLKIYRCMESSTKCFFGSRCVDSHSRPHTSSKNYLSWCPNLCSVETTIEIENQFYTKIFTLCPYW